MADESPTPYHIDIKLLPDDDLNGKSNTLTYKSSIRSAPIDTRFSLFNHCNYVRSKIEKKGKIERRESESNSVAMKWKKMVTEERENIRR